MKKYWINVRVTSITRLAKTYWGFSRYLIVGESFDGFNCQFKTTSAPSVDTAYQVLSSQAVGLVMQLLFHKTQNGNWIADYWGTGSWQGEDFEELFERQRAEHLAKKEARMLRRLVPVPPPEHARTAERRTRL